jgi:hypothetical protein
MIAPTTFGDILSTGPDRVSRETDMSHSTAHDPSRGANRA